MSLDEIHRAIPHRAPFLLLDQVVEREELRIVCTKTFREDEFWYAGHYPHFPLTPGVLLCEAALQAGAVLLSHHSQEPETIPVATRLNNVRFKRMVKPGETIRLEVQVAEQIANVFWLRARITVDSRLAARLEFACTMAHDPLTSHA